MHGRPATPYTVFGYGGKQVRDNIHCADVVARVRRVPRAPRAPAAVYNLGGGRECNCSMLEAIALCEQIAGRELDWTLPTRRAIGDHRWWISRPRRVPGATTRTGSSSYGIEDVLREIHDANVERWSGGCRR